MSGHVINDRKRRFDIVSTGSRGIINHIEYTVPDSKDINTTLNTIENYVNIKSKKMKKTKDLKKSSVSIAVQFSNGKWISTSYQRTGSKLDITDIYDAYGNDDDWSNTRIIGFSIQYIIN